jgi:hypothetical protein
MGILRLYASLSLRALELYTGQGGLVIYRNGMSKNG